MKKYTKSEIEGMIKSLEAKEKKARSKWGKAVLQDAQWLLENVLGNMKDGELPDDVKTAIETMSENHVEIADFTSVVRFVKKDTTYYYLTF